MLDPLPIGEKDKRPALKCSLCGLFFEEDTEDYESIDDTGRCEDCYQEWGDNYPDRI